MNSRIIEHQDVSDKIYLAVIKKATVEVTIDDGMDIYTGHFEDILPGGKTMGKQSYQPGSYVFSGTFLLLSPLEPAIGNVKVRRSKRIRIKFYVEQFTCEGWTRFEYVTDMGGVNLFRLTFPKKLIVYQERQEFRADLLGKEILGIVADHGGDISLEVELSDLSHNGVSFLAPVASSKVLVEGTEITLRIGVPEFAGLSLAGVVRSVVKARDKDDINLAHNKFGVQFGPLDPETIQGLNAFLEGELRAYLTFCHNMGLNPDLPSSAPPVAR